MVVLLPTHCPVCRSVGDAPCRRCVSQLAPAPEYDDPDGLLDATVALFAYDGTGAKLVTALKYANHRDALAPLARGLAAVVGLVAGSAPIDRVTWVPTTRARAARRGFDQAEVIAVVVASTLRVPVVRLLDRATDATQTGRDRVGRAAVAFEPRQVTSGRVVVVDDVRTTGASLRAAAAALRVAGAISVVGATLAATP